MGERGIEEEEEEEEEDMYPSLVILSSCSIAQFISYVNRLTFGSLYISFCTTFNVPLKQKL
jgi:hypothetical protein